MGRSAVLTDKSILALPVRAKRYSKFDALCPGLLVRVYPTGKRSLMLAARYPGHSSVARRQLGIHGQLLIDAARDKARRWLALIDKGIDPADEEAKERRANRQNADNTFGLVAEDYIRRRVQGTRKAERTEREIRNELVRPWGDIAVTDITKADLVRLVEAIVDRPKKTPTAQPQSGLYYAHAIFGHARSIFNWAINREIYKLDKSPADRLRPAVLIGAKKPRQRLLSDDEIRAFWAATEHMGYPAGSMYRMLLLTGCRLHEVGDARWREIQPGPAGEVFTVPPERFKSDAPHVVPITKALRALLDDLPRFKSGDHLFSATFGKTPIQNFGRQKARIDGLMLEELRRADPEAELEPWVNHDLRRVVRTHLSALRVPEPVAEAVIGHGKKGLARVYDQNRMGPEIREALEAWANRLRSIVEPPPANVVALRGNAR